MSVRRYVVSGLMVTALALAGCGAQADSPGGTGETTGANAAGRAEACLVGSWNVDVTDLAAQAAAMMRTGAGQGTGEGTITVTFGDTLTIRYANTLIVVSETNGMKVGVRDSYEGDAVSTDYTAKDGRIVGTLPGQAVKKTTAVIVGTQTQPATSGQIPGSLDLSQGQTGYTCSGNTATLSNGSVTWKLAKA